MKDISLYFWWLDFVLDSTYIIRSISNGMYITKNSGPRKAWTLRRFLWTRNQTVPEDYIYTTLSVGSSLHYNVVNLDGSRQIVEIQTTVLVFKTGFLVLRLRFEILGQPRSKIIKVNKQQWYSTFLLGKSVVTYFWDVFFRRAKATGTLRTWKMLLS